MNALVLMLVVSSTLVLQSGARIVADGPATEENGRITFRVAGVLYSLPSAEVVRIDVTDGSADGRPPVRRLRVSPEERRRLIAELEKNHAGAPAPRQPILEKAPPPPSREEIRAERHEEAQWRRDARGYEEAVRRASEELALLERREQELQSKIHGLLSLGFRPHQFTYDTSLLYQTREQLPYAQLEVERARRAYDQFREDARRAGVPPGWLR